MGLFGGKKKSGAREEDAEVRHTEPSSSAPVQKPVVERSSARGPSVAESSTKAEDEILAEVLDVAPKKTKKKEKKLELTTSVFEFGSAGGNKGMTLAGFCPISDEHEPCKWEVIEDGGPEQPAIRIIF